MNAVRPTTNYFCPFEDKTLHRDPDVFGTFNESCDVLVGVPTVLVPTESS